MTRLQDLLTTNINDEQNSFDDLMASLFVLITHHSLTQCEASLVPIIERLDSLCRHSEIEHYPNQRVVLFKMRHLWQTKHFKVENQKVRH